MCTCELIWLVVNKWLVCVCVIDVDTECDANNGTGDCSHICATTYNGHICQCRDGYELATDRRNCQGSCLHLIDTCTTSLTIYRDRQLCLVKLQKQCTLCWIVSGISLRWSCLMYESRRRHSGNLLLQSAKLLFWGTAHWTGWTISKTVVTSEIYNIILN